MADPQNLTLSSDQRGSVGPADPGRARAVLVTSALALGAATVAAVLAWKPWPERNDLTYEALAPVRDSTWVGITVDAAAFAVVAVALSLTVCLLVRGRGAGLANAGAVLAMLGGILFAMGAFGFAALAWHAAEATVVPPEVGTELLRYADGNPAHLLVLQMAGFLGYSVGTVLLSVALLRAAALPRWVPVSVLALTAAQFVPFPARALDLVQIMLMAVLVASAGVAFRTLTSGPRRSG
jgi:hypothetical protein